MMIKTGTKKKCIFWDTLLKFILYSYLTLCKILKSFVISFVLKLSTN